MAKHAKILEDKKSYLNEMANNASNYYVNLSPFMQLYSFRNGFDIK